MDAPFGDRALRVDCPEHEPASADVVAGNWAEFVASPGGVGDAETTPQP